MPVDRSGLGSGSFFAKLRQSLYYTLADAGIIARKTRNGKIGGIGRGGGPVAGD